MFNINFKPKFCLKILNSIKVYSKCLILWSFYMTFFLNDRVVVGGEQSKNCVTF